MGILLSGSDWWEARKLLRFGSGVFGEPVSSP
jgi:hypothetical protein